ncbi:MAG: preprotein translocase subunit YajC [Planctomycetota bacterium]|nr:preprotein translocase subunit YajC [Planctomycetota bacterium]
MKKKLAFLAALSLLFLPALACVPQQGQGEGGEGQSQGFDWVTMLLMFAPIAVVFYLFIIRPQKKQRNEQKEMIANLKKGDEILTIGGMFGRVVEVRSDRVTVELSDKVRVRVTTDAIAKVFEPEEEEDGE